MSWATIKGVGKDNWPVLLITLVTALVITRDLIRSARAKHSLVHTVDLQDSYWQAPLLYGNNIADNKSRKMIMYGRDLIAHTADYLGPNGSVAHISNGMNCQNCHLDAGARIWGNNYGAVASTYPKFRARSGTVENIYKRVNDCIERSLNGRALDTASYEMQSIAAYMQWLGKEVPKGVKPNGTGIIDVPYLDRAANAENGKKVFVNYCATCHGNNGQGQLSTATAGYEYPPLWGMHSYNTGAGLYRLSRFAGFVKANMPFKEASYNKTILTDEEAWDVAAYVNSQPRPQGRVQNDWPDISAKPFDYPFGPYADSFSQQQHKFGPFLPIVQNKKKL